ncbi:solute carrier family 22 member 5-like [Actinia tenebrosa]|uniref:Solute carrier family 22 member 5-like n=1 Tax=Actinia tenebrosa TaxID=6105 RepID=A0A6P8H088_ACTTE|nr:solute carrier family 22 member 5-like [Actinia tenebrosa]
MVFASLASIGTVLLMSDPDDEGLAVGCIITAMIAKFFIMISFDSIYVYSAELFPTVIRSVGMGTSSAAGRIGSFLSSYVIWLKRIHTILPYGIMGGAALIAGFLCMSLPETKDQPMPDVIDSTSTSEEILEKENKGKIDGSDEQHGSVVKLSPICRKLTNGRENAV